MTGTWCANFWRRYEHDRCGCVVVMQHNENASESAVSMSAQRVSGTTLGALTLAQPCACVQNVQKRSRTKDMYRLTAIAQQAPAEAWSCFIEEEGMKKSTSLAKVNETIKVKKR